MSRLILPVQFTQQPQYSAKIDWSHPAARFLTVAFNPAVSNANLAGTRGSLSPTGSIISANGVAATVSGEVSTGTEVLSVDYSFIVAFRTGTVGTGIKCIVGRGPSISNDNLGFGFDANHTSGSYAGAIFQGSSYSIIGKPTGGVIADNTDYIIGAASAGGSGSVFYNGVKTGSATGLSAVNTTGRLALGANSNLTTQVTVSFACYLQFNIKLPDALMASLSSNPWQIFKSPPRKLWVSPPLHTLIVPNSYQSPSSDTGIATQNHTLSGSASGQTTLSSAGIATQVHTLAGTASNQTASSVAGKVAISYSLAAGSVTQTAGVTTGAASQIQAIVGASNTQLPTSASAAITQSQTLTGLSVAQNTTTEAGLVAQNQALAGTNTSQGATTTNGSISLSFVLTAAPIAQNASSSQSSITQDQFMVFPPSVQDSISAASPIVQAQMLLGSDSVQLATSWYAIHYFMKAEVDVHPVVHAEFSTRGGVRARAKIVKR